MTPKHSLDPVFVPSSLNSPLEAEKMSRREYQRGELHERVGKAGPEYFIRYRIRVIKMVDGRATRQRSAKWVTLGTKKELTLAQAKRKRDEIMQQVNAQVYTVQSHIPMKEFAKVYKEQHFPGLKATSQRLYDHFLRRWVIPVLGDRKLYQVGVTDINGLLRMMESAKVSRNTRNSARGILSSMFECARKWGYTKDQANPARDAEVGRAKGNTRDLWTPTMEEARAVMAKADEETALMIELAIWTGMRIGEILGLRCANVDLENRLVYVREQISLGRVDTPKSKAGIRTLAIGSLAERLAPRMGAPDAWVFHDSMGQPYRDSDVYWRVRTACENAGLYRAGSLWHSFRRLHLTMMSQHLSAFDLQTQAGHASVSMTAHYVDQTFDARRRAIESEMGNVVEIRKKA